MITAIFTAEATTLTIKTSETVNLEQMGNEANPFVVRPGTHAIPVGVGVFRLLSKQEVHVSSDSPNTNIQQSTNLMNLKDGTFPDQTNLVTMSVDREATKKFFAAAKSISAPH